MPSKKLTRTKVESLALCIGIECYDHFSDLPTAPNDALTLAEHFADPNIGSFDHVIVVTDRFIDDLNPGQKRPKTYNNKPSITSEQIQAALKRVFEEFTFEKNGDSLLTFFFAGHAALDNNGNLYLFGGNGAKIDSRTIDIQTGFNLNAEFSHYLAGKNRPDNVVILLDACHAGAGKKLAGKLDAFTNPNTYSKLQQIYLIGGAQADQSALDDIKHGYFTTCLLEAFEQYTSDGRISMYRIQEYVAANLERVSNGSSQQIEGVNSIGKNIWLVQRISSSLLSSAFRNEVQKVLKLDAQNWTVHEALFDPEKPVSFYATFGRDWNAIEWLFYCIDNSKEQATPNIIMHTARILMQTDDQDRKMLVTYYPLPAELKNIAQRICKGLQLTTPSELLAKMLDFTLLPYTFRNPPRGRG